MGHYSREAGTMIQPAKPRATVAEDPEGLRIIIPAKRNWLLIPFLTLWLCGWFVGEVTVASYLVAGGDSRQASPFPFMIFWLAGWTLGGGFALFILLWQLFGKQVIVIRREMLSIRDELG